MKIGVFGSSFKLAPINSNRLEFDGGHLKQGALRTDLTASDFVFVHMRISNAHVLSLMWSFLAVEFWVPSWPEDQFESLKRAVIEIVFLQFGCRFRTSSFHLKVSNKSHQVYEELLSVGINRWSLPSQRVPLDMDVWSSSDRQSWGSETHSHTNTCIDLVFDWVPVMDWYSNYAVWPPAQVAQNLVSKL